MTWGLVVVFGVAGLAGGVVCAAINSRRPSAPSGPRRVRWSVDRVGGHLRRNGVGRDVPFDLWRPVKSLAGAAIHGSGMASQALDALWADLERLEAAGAPDDRYAVLGAQYERITARLFAAEEKHGIESGAARLALALDALDELSVVDEENGLRP